MRQLDNYTSQLINIIEKTAQINKPVKSVGCLKIELFGDGRQTQDKRTSLRPMRKGESIC